MSKDMMAEGMVFAHINEHRQYLKYNLLGWSINCTPAALSSFITSEPRRRDGRAERSEHDLALANR